MNKKVNAKIIKDIRQSKVLMACAVVSLLAAFVFPEVNGLFWGLAAGLGSAGAGAYWVLRKARKSETMQENILMELDERNQSLNMQAAAKAFWFSFYWIALAAICAPFQWVSAEKLLIASLFVMPGIYFSVSIYFHRVK